MELLLDSKKPWSSLQIIWRQGAACKKIRALELLACKLDSGKLLTDNLGEGKLFIDKFKTGLLYTDKLYQGELLTTKLDPRELLTVRELTYGLRTANYRKCEASERLTDNFKPRELITDILKPVYK